MENKDKLAMELAPRIEKIVEERLESRITHNVVKAIIEKLEEDFYPPEEMIKKEFIREMEEAENRIKQGKCKTYSYREFKTKFCEQNAL
ncbi:hypothetical protein D4Q76_01805 [archaeon]|nr:MAG: hypothetical protein D4Q76_01805 [archaeon]